MQNPNIPEDWKQTIRGYVPKDEREAAEKAELVKQGDLVVITAGVPLGKSGSTNLIKVLRF